MSVWLYKQTNEDRIKQLMNQNAASVYTKSAKKNVPDMFRKKVQKKKDLIKEKEKI